MKYFNKKLRRSSAPSSAYFRGFTLIELLVVISIIGILATVVLVSLNSIRARSRDGRRLADIKTLRDALAMYQIRIAGYPVVATETTVDGSSDPLSQSLKSEQVLTSVPIDPINAVKDGVSYFYTYQSADGSTYLIKYCMETDSFQGRTKDCNNEAKP